ncbi:MAG: hypothetical protein ACKO34_07325 [Vampirovibrionales bacterium]
MMNTVGLSQPNVTVRAAANPTNINELEAKAKQAKEQQAKPMVANAAPAGVGAKLNIQG